MKVVLSCFLFLFVATSVFAHPLAKEVRVTNGIYGGHLIGAPQSPCLVVVRDAEQMLSPGNVDVLIQNAKGEGLSALSVSGTNLDPATLKEGPILSQVDLTTQVIGSVNSRTGHLQRVEIDTDVKGKRVSMSCVKLQPIDWMEF